MKSISDDKKALQLYCWFNVEMEDVGEVVSNTS